MDCILLIIIHFIWNLPQLEPSLFSLGFLLEQFSIECRKTKTKVITLANQKGRRAIHCPIKTRSNYTKTREACVSKSRLVVVLLLIGRVSGAIFLSQSPSVQMQNQSKRKSVSTLKWNRSIILQFLGDQFGLYILLTKKTKKKKGF